ncbi:MAG TPA: serine hydrolase domain-containing protein [Gemmataceae bacterium]|nr:serine hydrolase domain-containing protein [Gemmataceae bacterium]
MVRGLLVFGLAAGQLAVLAALGITAPAPGSKEKAASISVTGKGDPNLTPFDDLMIDFLKRHKVPGAALAVSKDSRLVYARGFGLADVEAGQAVQPNSLMRIASVSKPITALAILLLIQQGKLKLDDHVFAILKIQPFLPPGARVDPRLKDTTVRHLLQHTGGFDRDKSGDPMFMSVEIATALKVQPPATADQILSYMMGKPLDFTPGKDYIYSNYGYCVLGRLIEKVSGQSYEDYVRQAVLTPLGMKHTRVGKTLLAQRAPGEVKYYDKHKGIAVVGPDLGKKAPSPYGAWYIEAMDAHGGWIASAPDLLRFACSFDKTAPQRLLKPANINLMFARPKGPAGYDAKGKPREGYYGLGWDIVPDGKKGEFNTWHTGLLDDTASLLVRRHDGLNWAVLFNASNNPKGRYLADIIDPLVHQAADQVKTWPAYNLFGKRGL